MPKKELIGRVVSDKMEKTIVVAVETKYPHPKYGKIIKKTNRFKAHDEENTSHTGDTVRIRESRPLSRDKRWELTEIVHKTL
ncbi:MAG TPA: 30S ribosomal protein S17 [Cyanobacteria bacterium UBA8530]|nr:30S ribosomal protein S17 [Cyanobacteria bacterium UBA8530]